MARVTTYLNFPGNTEEAFLFYKSVFKTEFITPFMRFSDGPPCPGQPPMPAEQGKMIMHVSLPILGGHVLMGIGIARTTGRRQISDAADSDAFVTASRVAVCGLVARRRHPRPLVNRSNDSGRSAAATATSVVGE